jgi:hypothetical protein
VSNEERADLSLVLITVAATGTFHRERDISALRYSAIQSEDRERPLEGAALRKALGESEGHCGGWKRG